MIFSRCAELAVTLFILSMWWGRSCVWSGYLYTLSENPSPVLSELLTGLSGPVGRAQYLGVDPACCPSLMFAATSGPRVAKITISTSIVVRAMEQDSVESGQVLANWKSIDAKYVSDPEVRPTTLSPRKLCRL